MRTIKFKARRLDNGEWAKGDLVHSTGYFCIYYESDKYPFGPVVHRVNPDTICQFTGFLDKNGKEVYEGDVLRSDEFPFSFINEQRKYPDLRFGLLVWDKDKCKFSMLCYTNKKHELTVDKYFEGANYDINQLWCSKFEVVGSIHDKEWKEKLNLKSE